MSYDHWAHTLYKKILNMFKLLKNYLSSLSSYSHQCLRGCTFAARWQQHSCGCADAELGILPNFDFNFSHSQCTDFTDSCDSIFMWGYY